MVGTINSRKMKGGVSMSLFRQSEMVETQLKEEESIWSLFRQSEMVETQLKEEESIQSLFRYSEMVGTINSRKMKGGVYMEFIQVL